MKINLTIAQNCSKEIKKCRTETSMLCDAVRSVCNELNMTENDEIEMICLDLRRKIRKLEEHVEQLGAMDNALDNIVSVYDRTEKKNTSRAGLVTGGQKGIPELIPINDRVPANIHHLVK